MSGCTQQGLDAQAGEAARQAYIHSHCDSQFRVFNFVSIYYDLFGQSGILTTGLVLIMVTIVFIHMNLIADAWLSLAMRKLARKLRLSPAVAAVTITSLAAGAPDLMSIVNNADRAEGLSISVGLLLGSFLFCTTLVISNVLMSSISNIKLEQWPVVKELSFYLVGMLVIIGFGLYGQVNYGFVAVFLCLYAFYIFMTVRIDKWKPPGQPYFDPEEERDRLILQATSEYHHHYELTESVGGSTMTEVSWEDMIAGIKDELHDDRKNPLINLVCYPLALFGLLAIPFPRNPLMKTRFRYIIYVLACFFFVDSVFYVTMSVLLTFSAALVIALLAGVLDFFRVAKPVLKYFVILLTLGCSVMALKLYVLAVLDCIAFLTFFVSIDAVILSALLLSAGVSMGDFFSNSALAHQGELGMATLACFANQNFNLLLGLSASVYVNLRRGVSDFDLFGLHETGPRLLMRHWFMCVLFAVCFVNIAFHWLHYRQSAFHLEKWFGKLLVLEYLGFLAAAVLFAAISHWTDF